MTDLRAMEYGRLLIRNGRSWLALTDDEVEHGARCVVRDPKYREEIGRCAVNHARAVGDPVLTAMVCEAWDRLNEAAPS